MAVADDERSEKRTTSVEEEEEGEVMAFEAETNDLRKINGVSHVSPLSC